MRMIASVVLAALALGVPASAKGRDDKAPASTDARIPFANHGGIYNFEADGENALYLQDRNMRWYHATLLGPCIDLPFANAIGYQVDGTDTFDHFSSIIVRGQRCPLESLSESEAPPKRQKTKK